MKRFYAPRLLHPNYYIYFGASWNYYFLDEGDRIIRSLHVLQSFVSTREKAVSEKTQLQEPTSI